MYVHIRIDTYIDAWHLFPFQDRWGHAEDEECCGDGINVGGGSGDSYALRTIESWHVRIYIHM